VPVERYEALTSVLESNDHGPELCLGGVLDSMPPQCGDVPITNWDWAAIDGEQTVQDTTWIDTVLVIGTFDGTSFTTESAQPANASDRARFAPQLPDTHAPCPEPPGGWLAAASKADPAASLEMTGPIGTYVDGQPDGGGWWLDQSINPDLPTDGNDPRKLVLVATFTGDLERHEADLRALWSGALCVTAAKYSAKDLRTLAADVNAAIQDDGRLPLPNGTTLRVLGFSESGNFLTGTVELDVMVADPLAQQYYDDTYGAGRVVLHGQLRPVG
jgi:hypothetical protein